MVCVCRGPEQKRHENGMPRHKAGRVGEGQLRRGLILGTLDAIKQTFREYLVYAKLKHRHVL